MVPPIGLDRKDRRRLPGNGFQVLLSILAVLVVVGKCRFLSQLSYLLTEAFRTSCLGTLFPRTTRPRRRRRSPAVHPNDVAHIHPVRSGQKSIYTHVGSNR
jgi:hypothetical protein